MKRKLTALCILLALLLGALPARAAETNLLHQETIQVNGTSVTLPAYLIAGTNYFKLRDLASALSGTEKQFDVGWDASAKAVAVTTGKPYASVGGASV